MQVEIKKQVTDTINIEPGYYKNKLIDTAFYYLRPSGALIYVNTSYFGITSPGYSSYSEYIKEIIERYQPCEQSEFEEAKDKLLCHLAQYVSFPELATNVNPTSGKASINNMFIDPNEQKQQEEATAEQAAGQDVQATEQAAQENAMESAEEGGTEG